MSAAVQLASELEQAAKEASAQGLRRETTVQDHGPLEGAADSGVSSAARGFVAGVALLLIHRCCLGMHDDGYWHY